MVMKNFERHLLWITRAKLMVNGFCLTMNQIKSTQKQSLTSYLFFVWNNKPFHKCCNKLSSTWLIFLEDFTAVLHLLQFLYPLFLCILIIILFFFKVVLNIQYEHPFHTTFQSYAIHHWFINVYFVKIRYSVSPDSEVY